MTHLLTNCATCAEPFTARDFPPLQEPLVFTVCYHIFHHKCLGRWVDAPQKDCPTCRAPVYKHQLGKSDTTYLKILLVALSHDPDIVLHTLQTSQHVTSQCAAGCADNLPLVPLQFDTEKKALVHARCSSKNMPDVLMQDLASIVKQIVAKYPHLQIQFTPTPLTLPQRMVIEYPITSRFALIESISIAAYFLNRHGYAGSHRLLSIIGFPAHVTIHVAQHLGLLPPPKP